MGVLVEWSLPYISKSTSSAAQRAPKAGFHCSFTWPPVTDGVVRLSALQLSVLLSGLPWERLQAPPIFRPRAAC